MTVPEYLPASIRQLAAEWQSWSGTSLRELCAGEGAFLRPSPELVEALLAERAGLGAWLREALDASEGAGDFRRRPDVFAAREIVRWLRGKNQFFDLDPAGLETLTAALRGALERARELLLSRTPAVEAAPALAALFEAQREHVAELVRAALGPNPPDVVAAEYSPELALDVLGLEPERLVEPVLDVGCGRSAALVRSLRERGLTAFGLDREAPPIWSSADDWLSFDFGVEQWGTVLSHLGFSLHFLHHHLRCDDSAFVYARTYMRVLRSLKPGGVFAYAPALPFIEELLPASSYARDSGPLPEALRNEAVVRVERATGLLLGSASRIRRLAA